MKELITFFTVRLNNCLQRILSFIKNFFVQMNHILCTTFELNNKPYIHKAELVGISAKGVG